MTPLEKIIRERIAREGPLDVADFMDMAVSHYYATRDPFGAKGDFVTAPEISQMFGELVGLWAADAWLKLGRPAAFQLVECGPGRGTLMADALRAAKNMPGFAEGVRIFMLENSPLLIEKQKAALKDCKIEWIGSLDNLKGHGPVILLANEFLDALPVVQTAGGKRRTVIVRNGRLSFDPAGGAIRETSPAREVFVRQVAHILKARGGAALFIDYGYEAAAEGDTLQAVREHRFVDVLDFVGEADLTSHVDFGAVKAAAESEGVKTIGPVTQGAFLRRLGIAERTDMLLQGAKDMKQRGDIAAALARLTAPEQMGRLFKVMALWHGDLQLEGF